MNDRFLFRGKREYNGSWIQGSLIHNAFVTAETREPIMYIFNSNNGSAFDCWHDMTEDLDVFAVITATVGQCTGLKDKHGTLIFEGDIIKVGNELEESW